MLDIKCKATAFRKLGDPYPATCLRYRLSIRLSIYSENMTDTTSLARGHVRPARRASNRSQSGIEVGAFAELVKGISKSLQ